MLSMCAWCWVCVCGAGHAWCWACVVLGGVGALPHQATLSLLSLCCGHVAIVVVVAPWQWPQASCHHCCHCGVAMFLSLSLLWCHGSGHRHHVVIIVTVVWPCHRYHHHCGTVAVATGITSSLSLWCGLVAVTVIPWSRCHCLRQCCGGIMMVVGSQWL